jgi:hypothetical protein
LVGRVEEARRGATGRRRMRALMVSVWRERYSPDGCRAMSRLQAASVNAEDCRSAERTPRRRSAAG